METVKNLEYMFNPRSIAFVGATEAKAKWGFIILNNLVSGGYSGEIHPVNPGHETIMGMRCYPSVREVPGEVDLAVFTVPAAQVVKSMDDCVAKGVKAGLVISAGFREVGSEGERLEADLVRKADAAGMAIIGPNGQGICCPKSRVYSWMPLFYPPGGSMSFVCQSGNILNMVIEHAIDSGFGVAKGVSSGNEAQLKTEDLFRCFMEDPDTDVIVSYLEGVADGRRFFDAARSVTRSKPVVLLKGGRSGSGIAAARSHTGAMAVEGHVFEAACRQAGIITTRTIQETGITASSFVNRPLPRGRRVGIVTGGGGLGVVAADACAEEGLEVAALSGETLDRIARLLPPHFVPGNPVDLVAGLDLTVIKPIIETLMRSGEVDSVMFLFVEAPRTEGVSTGRAAGLGFELQDLWDLMTRQLLVYLDELFEPMHECGVPLYPVLNFTRVKKTSGRDETPAERITTIYNDIESACAAVSAMVRYHEYRNRPGP